MTERQAPDRSERAREYRARGWWRDDTLADDIARHAAARPDAAAFITENERLSWREYAEASDYLAGVLVAAGFERGERVAVQLPDTAAVHLAFVALEKAGLVAVGIGARAGDREVRYLLGRTGASGLITHAQHRGRLVADDVDSLRADAPKLRHHVVLPEKLTDHSATVDGAGLSPAPRRAVARPQARARRTLAGQLDVGHHRPAQVRHAPPEPLVLLPPDRRGRRRTAL